jgi:cytochrome bd-type quinol oxidase subunit 1
LNDIWVLDIAQDGDLAFDLGQSRGIATDNIAFDHLYSKLQGVSVIARVARKSCKTYLDIAVLLPTELDLSKLALANRVAQNEISNLSSTLVLPVAMVMSTAATPALLLGWAHANYGRWSWVIIPR